MFIFRHFDDRHAEEAHLEEERGDPYGPYKCPNISDAAMNDGTRDE